MSTNATNEFSKQSPEYQEFFKAVGSIRDERATHSNIWKKILQAEREDTVESDYGRILDGYYLNHLAILPERPEDVGSAERLANQYGKYVLKGAEECEKTFSQKLSEAFPDWQRSHALTVAFLKSVGLLEEYVGFCKAYGFRSDFSLARQFYYMRNVNRLLEHVSYPAGRTFFEVGAGSGTLAVLLALTGKVQRYYIVDLPQMLPYSAHYVRKLVPAAKLFFGEKEIGRASEGISFYFLAPSETQSIPEASVDVSVNINSFMEMDRSTLEFYFAQIYRMSRAGALHFNVNRIQSKLVESTGEPFHSNPLLYPYRADDKILFWDAEPLQTATRTGVMDVPPSTTFVRAAVLGGDKNVLPLPVTEFDPIKV